MNNDKLIIGGHEFNSRSRIDVYAPYRENKQRHQRIDIYYHGVGYVFIPEPEEVEEMFQEHLRDRNDNIKVKTA